MKPTHYKVDIIDGTNSQEKVVGKIIEMQKYIVTAEKGIFKRGKLWKKGATIELDKVTGNNFVNNKELKVKK